MCNSSGSFPTIHYYISVVQLNSFKSYLVFVVNAIEPNHMHTVGQATNLKYPKWEVFLLDLYIQPDGGYKWPIQFTNNILDV